MSTTKKPAFRAYGIVTRKGKDYFADIGAAWPTEKGGFTIRLHALPLGDKIVLLPPKAVEETPPAE